MEGRLLKRVLVIRGGVAGPVAATALRRAVPEPTVCEARAEAADGRIGADPTVAVNGLPA